MKQEQYTKKSNKTKKKESVSAKNFEAKRIHDIKKKKKKTLKSIMKFIFTCYLVNIIV